MQNKSSETKFKAIFQSTQLSSSINFKKITILHFCLNTAHHSKHTVTNGDDLSCSSGSVVVSDAKRVLVGAGARALFYPTLLYNVVRNKIQSEFRWWDRIDELILLGAVPFPADVPRLRELGVSGVVTLNKLHETLVPTSLYHAHNIDRLVIPTRAIFLPLHLLIYAKL